jgi:hypothetical protein
MLTPPCSTRRRHAVTSPLMVKVGEVRQANQCFFSRAGTSSSSMSTEGLFPATIDRDQRPLSSSSSSRRMQASHQRNCDGHTHTHAHARTHTHTLREGDHNVGTVQRVLVLAQQTHDIDIARLNALAHSVRTTRMRLYACERVSVSVEMRVSATGIVRRAWRMTGAVYQGTERSKALGTEWSELE